MCAVVGVLIASASACSPAPPPGAQIVVVGDSYTMGPNDDPNDPAVWPALIWKRMRAEGYSIAPTVSGEGGAGYAHPGYRGGTFAQKADVIQPYSELIVFFGSANDMTVPPEELKQAVHDVLSDARVTAPKAHLLVIGPAWPRPEVPQTVLEVRDIVRAEAAALGATFVDPLEQRWLWDDPGLIGSDGIHPNREGQLYLSGKVGPLIQAELPPPSP
jgi:lysophospholipase L1-like esterase